MFKDRHGTAFPQLINPLLLDTARGNAQKRVPIWIMRQAGRYLPEYHETRNKAKDFFGLCQNPDYATEVTLQPIDRFELDAAIIFSDILVVPQAMGMEVLMSPGKGPVFPSPLLGPEDLTRLTQPTDLAHPLQFTIEAIQQVRHQLKGRVPVIGFSGAPWTLMAYMIEGEGSKTFSKAKSWLYKYPKESHQLLQNITDVVIIYLTEQARGGAQLLKVFDSWAGILSPAAFKEFCLPYLQQIEKRVKENLQKEAELFEYIPPMIVFAKGAHYSMESVLLETTYEVVALDWETNVSDIVQLCEKHKRKVCLQGNLDPCVLYADESVIKEHTKNMIEEFHGSQYVTHIANLGHGVSPDHDPEKVKCFIDSVHQFSDEIYK